MGAFSTKRTLYGDTARIPQVAEKIRQAFVNEGYIDYNICIASSSYRTSVGNGSAIQTR